MNEAPKAIRRAGINSARWRRFALTGAKPVTRVEPAKFCNGRFALLKLR
jgi:hypothetical protein